MDDLTLRSRLQSLQTGELGGKPQKPQGGDGPAFGEVLKNAIADVNQLQADADKTIQDLQLGKNVDIHDAMIALNKMDVSFKMLMEVRNKLLNAYQEVMRMQV